MREIPAGKLVKAAINVDGKILTGIRHLQILKDNDLMDRLELLTDAWASGFVTEDGHFLTRNQAKSYAVYYIEQIKEDDVKGVYLTSDILWDDEGNLY